GTYALFAHTLSKMGITVHFVDVDQPEQFTAKINEKTKAVFIETIGNPRINVADIETIADIAHEHGIPLIVDSTFTPPHICRPIEFGSDVVVHSATTFIGGHGTSLGGIIVDSGKFNWDHGKFPMMTEPYPSYHGIVYTEAVGPLAYIMKARLTLLRDI